MNLVFLVIAVLMNFFNYSLVKAEENIENIAKKESITENKDEIRKIHIVKIGDTISSISELYSIDKNLIINLNELNDENYIFVGQNLIISESTNNSKKQSDLKNYHIVKTGENLTDISNIHKLNLGYLIEINNLDNPDSIKVGQKLLLNKNESISLENHEKIKNKRNNELLLIDRQFYGPLIIQSKSDEEIKGRKVLNVLNQKNEKLILSINCDTNQLNVRIPGKKWKGPEPAKEEFENNLINDFC